VEGGDRKSKINNTSLQVVEVIQLRNMSSHVPVQEMVQEVGQREQGVVLLWLEPMFFVRF